VILPALNQDPNVERILFVGCDRYTAHYPALFTRADFVTIDIDPSKARYGARHHVTDTVLNLHSHFEEQSFDVIVCNGVFGWGIDRRTEVDEAARVCFEYLRPGGMFLVGWNDLAPWQPPPFDELDAFQKFIPFTLDPFPGPVYPTLGRLRHVFSFFRRPEAPGTTLADGTV
jgi:SAM-dependent methyltransferase